jgi:RimJ/RimL family protein N-acetyltransferase
VSALSLRCARSTDCEAIWRWNFAPDVRAQSRRAEAVGFIEHARWFARRLADSDAPIWVIEEILGEGRNETRDAVGVVRLDPPEYGRSRISIALAGSARGRGLGRAAVTAACRSWDRPVAAEIFTDNTASRACFEACGFRAIASCDGLMTYHWDPET